MHSQDQFSIPLALSFRLLWFLPSFNLTTFPYLACVVGYLCNCRSVFPNLLLFLPTCRFLPSLPPVKQNSLHVHVSFSPSVRFLLVSPVLSRQLLVSVVGSVLLCVSPDNVPVLIGC